MSKFELPNPLRSNPVSPRNKSYPPITMPLSPPSTVTSPMGNMYITSGPAKQHLPSLTPLPLSPPILKPSTKPPLSLNAPNPTTRTNFSPTSPVYDFPAAYPIAGYSHTTPKVAKRLVSHSASASVPMATATPANTQATRSKQRSPSQPHLPSYFTTGNPQQPPAIPLRMSSIPTNNKPRKLSLQTQRSLCTLKPRASSDEKENVMASAQAAGSTTPRRVSPPLRTNKALPSPPMNVAEEMRTREKVMGGSSPKEWSMYPTPRDSPPRGSIDDAKRSGQVWPDGEIGHPGIAELPAISAKGSSSHSHQRSSSVSATLTQPFQSPDVEALAAAASHPHPHSHPQPQAPETEIQPTAPLKDSPRSKAKATMAKSPIVNNFNHAPSSSHKGKDALTELGGWAASTHTGEGRPVQQSRTQKDKDRKKRSKAQVLIEHVDVIKDEFWEKRPWILSGKTG